MAAFGCSPRNSRKYPSRQGDVFREVATHLRSGSSRVLGVMLGSHIHAGRQDWKPGKPLEYGGSIPDGSIDFEDTETLLRDFAKAARPRATRRIEGVAISAA